MWHERVFFAATVAMVGSVHHARTILMPRQVSRYRAWGFDVDYYAAPASRMMG